MDTSKLVIPPVLKKWTLGQFKQISRRLLDKTGMVMDREHPTGSFGGFSFEWEYVEGKGWLIGVTSAPKSMEPERVGEWVEIIFDRPETLEKQT